MTRTRPGLAEECIRSQPQLVIGIGSPHGDDRAGWAIAEQLSSDCALTSVCQVRKAAVPHDILDWIQPNTLTHIVDACLSDISSVERYQLIAQNSKPDTGSHLLGPALGEYAAREDRNELSLNGALSNLRSSSSHQFDLRAVLQLANELGQLPRQLVLWVVPALNLARGDEIHARTMQLICQCAIRIRQELRRA
ncbi:MAG: hypothetical protein KDB22_14835 [Planctomycetales bacterium]|nr:hypothetical protein [Planctomycetales bacterium]